MLKYPEVPDMLWVFEEWQKLIVKKDSLPPFCLLTVSAMSNEQGKHLVVNVRKLHANAEMRR